MVKIAYKYARVAQSSIRLLAPSLALLAAPLSYTQTSGSTQLAVAPAALTFTGHRDGPAPDPQTLTVSGPSDTPITIVPSLGFTMFLTASVGGLVLQSNGQTNLPAVITVGVVWPPADILAYDGSIKIVQTGTSTTVVVPVSLSIVPPMPTISPGGIVPVGSTVNTIQPGEWVSIYGSNLANSTAIWKGDFPTSLGGTSVMIDGRPAYLSLVSRTQINLQAPDDPKTGSVSVVVTTPIMQATSSVTLAEFAPSFFLLDSKHVAGIIPRSNGSGAYGGGSYDILGPTGTSLGYPTLAATPGDVVELFGTGFGQTNPDVQSCQAFSGAAPTKNPVSLLINNENVTPSFSGLAGAGLDQINVTIPPGLGSGDVMLAGVVGGVQTPAGVVISLQ